MVEKLKQMKKETHMTNQQIAEKSNIPESTVARIFSGKTPNPTVTTVVSMARAMGGSAADLLNEEDGTKTDENAANNAMSQKSDESVEKTAAAEQGLQHSGDITPTEKMYEDMINLYKDEIRKKDVWISRLFWCAAGIVAFILFILIFDILHPNFGFVKY